MGLLEQKLKGLLSYIDANTPRAPRPVAKPSQVINQGLINPNKYNEPAASRFKDSAFGLLGVVPGVGDAASAVESADLFNRGENFAGSMAALGALPLVPAFAGMVKQGGNVADALGPAMSKADEAGGLLGKVDNAGMGKRGMVKQGGKAADALPLGNNLSDDEVFRKMWDALDNAGDGYIGVRGDDFPVKTKFRKSWNRPDGERTTRLPGTSVIGLGVDNITEESLREAIKSARGYGKNLYLIEGEAPHRIQYLANDPGEHLVTDHKILWSTLFD